MSDEFINVEQYGEKLGYDSNQCYLKCLSTSHTSNVEKMLVLSKVMDQLSVFKIFCYTGLLSFLVSLGTVGISSIINQMQKNNMYCFHPDSCRTLIFYRDRIDTYEKLQAIQRDSSIFKEHTPDLGALVTQDLEGLYVISASKIQQRWDSYPISPTVSYDYQYGYKFIPNVVTISKEAISVEKIKTKSMLKVLLKTGKIAQESKKYIGIGMYIWKKSAHTYGVLPDYNLL